MEFNASGALLKDHSYFSPYGYSSESCGYCKNTDTGTSYYAHTSKLTVDHYQLLIDRGWRRSGTLLYLPDPKRACCPHYTIRLPASSFRPSRDQRQAVNRWNRFVLGEDFLRKRRLRHSKAEKAKERNGFDLIEAIHESESVSISAPKQSRKSGDEESKTDHEFIVTLEENDMTEEKYKLFEHYQSVVHGDAPSHISKSGFKRFLCQSPLATETREVNGKLLRLGSFHQCYRLDGRLIAIGVLDLLPHAVSGVYFIYHQDFERFSFGKLSALREAAMAREAGYEYYYMGYYIHSCPKMRYKSDYKPQYILDLESHEWDPLDKDVQAKLDERKYVSLSSDRASSPESQRRNELKYSSPSEAAAAFASGLSVFDLQLPGIMSLAEVDEKIDVGAVLLAIGKDVVLPAGRLASLSEESIKDSHSLKGTIGQFAACVGPEVASHMVIELG